MTKEATLLNGVEEDTTSSAFSIDGYDKIGLQFKAASITSGNGVFTVEGTINGTDWVALNVLVDNVTNTNAQDLTRVAAKTLSSNSTVLVWLDSVAALKAIRVAVDVTTDGAYTANIIVSN